eukprot:Gregarina_sp_Poly_1__5915@NODE_3113_length_1369_cov_6_483871_g1974_i0_p1_GENE_NODE_3113_length_1369_cov_6_483871_g1974_i0NODE_3113_length_1369_cov_6_483871_g1974_i0_p1_ORF_typecomplete_len171_score11_68_NODE_3113_length_1369_cov_6_483871_g1974_i0386898
MGPPSRVNGKMMFTFSDGSHLIFGPQQASLVDAEGALLGTIPLVLDKVEGLGKKITTIPGDLSGLQHPPPAQPVINLPPPPPPIEGVYQSYPAEMYCRYGCGNIMGVTFPYYYRPFFGYGFPLLGSEQYFPQGYGGNPITPMGAAGLLGPPGPPGSVMAPPGSPALGAIL